MFTSLDGRAQLLDPADRRDQPDPVREQDEQEERREDRDVGSGGRAGDADAEVAQALVERLEDVLEATRDELARRGPSRMAPTRTIAMTIHSVKIVELMLGVKVTSASAGPCGPMTVCGAGNSSVPSMKQAG